MPKLVLIADTHGRNNLLDGLPHGDVLIHAGDCTRYGSRSELQEFAEIYGELPHRDKILIAGNHDGAFQRHPEEAQDIVRDAGITYLEDSSITIDGLKYWGIPWVPQFENWAFMGDNTLLLEKWRKIPLDVDVIISHGPPRWILDGHWHHGSSIHYSYVSERPNLKLNAFGHIHEGYGFHYSAGITYINCSLLDEDYIPRNAPAEIYLPAI